MMRHRSGIASPILPSPKIYEVVKIKMDEQLDHMWQKLKTKANNIPSVNSIDDVLKSENEQPMEAWTADLAERITEIIDRKRSSIQGRESCLTIYIRILTNQYAEEDIRGKEAELVAAFLKSIKTESSERETVLAIKGRWLHLNHFEYVAHL